MSQGEEEHEHEEEGTHYHAIVAIEDTQCIVSEYNHHSVMALVMCGARAEPPPLSEARVFRVDPEGEAEEVEVEALVAEMKENLMVMVFATVYSMS